MAEATCGCGARWSGTKLEHCTVCHRTFSSTRNGDRHRTGKHHLSVGPDRRRCMTDEECAKAGLAPSELSNGSIVWRSVGENPLKTMQRGDQDGANAPALESVDPRAADSA